MLVLMDLQALLVVFLTERRADLQGLVDAGFGDLDLVQVLFGTGSGWVGDI